jgi:hypothetical protein
MDWSPVDRMLYLSMMLTVLVFHLRPHARTAKTLSLLGLVLPHWCALRCGMSQVAEWGMMGGMYLTALIFAVTGLRLRGIGHGVKKRRFGLAGLRRIRRVDWNHRRNLRSGFTGMLLVLSAVGLGLCAKWLLLRLYDASASLLVRFALYDIMAEGFILLAGLAIPLIAARAAGNWFRRFRHPVRWSLACLLANCLGALLIAVAAGWFAPLLVRSDLLYRFAPMLPLPGLWLLAERVTPRLKRWLCEPDSQMDMETNREDGACEKVESGGRLHHFPGHCWRRVVPPLSLSLAALCLVLCLVRPFGGTPPAYPVAEEMRIVTRSMLPGKEKRTGDQIPQRVLCLSANRHGLLAVRNRQVAWIPWVQIESLEFLNRYGQASLAEVRRW